MGKELGKQRDLIASVPLQLNHFPGSFQIGRKDRLWRNLLKMQARCGKKEFNFFPQTFILPQDIKLLKKAWEEGASRQKWIVKPVGVKQSSILCPFVGAGRRSNPFLCFAASISKRRWYPGHPQMEPAPQKETTASTEVSEYKTKVDTQLGTS